MSPVHFHLLLNHVAIMAALFSVPVFLYGLIRKNETIQNVSYAGFVLAALTVIPVFLTGEPAEEAVEKLPGVLESAIEQHETMAEIATWLVVITGIIALGALLRNKIRFFRSPVIVVAMVFASLAAASTIGYTGYLGGKIRHTEIAGAQTIIPGNGGENGNDED